MLLVTAEYALRAMTQLAVVAPKSTTTQEIAEQTNVPRAYLSRVLQRLRFAGLITAQRGVGGGVKLARPAKKISLLEVVEAMQPWQRSVDAPKGKARASLAPLNVKVDAILSQLHKSLAATSLTDIAK